MEAFKKEAPETQFIVESSAVDTDRIHRAKALGADFVFIKPDEGYQPVHSRGSATDEFRLEVLQTSV